MASTKATKTADTPTREWEEIDPFTDPITMADGDEFEARYMGGSDKQVPAREDDKDESITVDENGRRIRRAILHEFVHEGETELFALWGSAVLDKRLENVPGGSYVKVVYEGKAELDGGRTARRYRVFIDKSAAF